MELIVSFPDDIEVSSGQLKRFKKYVIHPKFVLRVEATSFCFDNNLSFSSNIRFSCILLFLFEKYGLHAFWNGSELQSKLSFWKYCNLAGLFIQIYHQASLLLKLDNVTRVFWLIWLVFETWSGLFLLAKVLIKMGLLIPS